MSLLKTSIPELLIVSSIGNDTLDNPEYVSPYELDAYFKALTEKIRASNSPLHSMIELEDLIYLSNNIRVGTNNENENKTNGYYIETNKSGSDGNNVLKSRWRQKWDENLSTFQNKHPFYTPMYSKPYRIMPAQLVNEWVNGDPKAVRPGYRDNLVSFFNDWAPPISGLEYTALLNKYSDNVQNIKRIFFALRYWTITGAKTFNPIWLRIVQDLIVVRFTDTAKRFGTFYALEDTQTLTSALNSIDGLRQELISSLNIAANTPVTLNVRYPYATHFKLSSQSTKFWATGFIYPFVSTIPQKIVLEIESTINAYANLINNIATLLSQRVGYLEDPSKPVYIDEKTFDPTFNPFLAIDWEKSRVSNKPIFNSTAINYRKESSTPGDKNAGVITTPVDYNEKSGQKLTIKDLEEAYKLRQSTTINDASGLSLIDLENYYKGNTPGTIKDKSTLEKALPLIAGGAAILALNQL